MGSIKIRGYKSAFTLAEVLITLAIIGVVAALTIPTVVTNYKNKALETQKKKSISVLTNGFRMLMAEDGVTSLKDAKIESCGEDKACLTNEIKRVFNVISDNNSENDIFDTEYQYKTKKVWKDNYLKYVFVTSDGMVFGLQPWTRGVYSVKVDLNGAKNPNKGGQDLCMFQISERGKILDQCDSMLCDSSHFAGCDQEQCIALGGEWLGKSPPICRGPE